MVLRLLCTLFLEPGLGKDDQGAQRTDGDAQVMDDFGVARVVDKIVVRAACRLACIADGVLEGQRGLPSIDLGALREVTEALGGGGSAFEVEHADGTGLEGQARAARGLRDLVDGGGVADEDDEGVGVALGLAVHSGRIGAREHRVFLIVLDAERTADDFGGLAGAQGGACPDHGVGARVDKVADGLQRGGHGGLKRAPTCLGQGAQRVGLPFFRWSGFAVTYQNEHLCQETSTPKQTKDQPVHRTV